MGGERGARAWAEEEKEEGEGKRYRRISAARRWLWQMGAAECQGAGRFTRWAGRCGGGERGKRRGPRAFLCTLRTPHEIFCQK